MEFIYIFPGIDLSDKRRWIRGIICFNDIDVPADHNHPVKRCLSHKIPSMVTADITRIIRQQSLLILTTQQLASGQGLGNRPDSAEVAGTSYGRLDYTFGRNH